MLDRLRDRPTWLLSRAHLRAHHLLRDSFDQAGSSGYHYRLLAALDERGTASQADLGRLAELDRSDVTSTVDVLARGGLVRRTPDPGDRRRNLVGLTPSGRRELRRLDAVLSEVQERFLVGLSATERRTLIRLLLKLADEPG